VAPTARSGHRRVGRRALVAASVILAACGGSGSRDSGDGGSTPSGTRDAIGDSAQVDVCSIVTAEDAQTVFGSPARTRDATGTVGGAIGICLYEGVDDPATLRNLLRVYGGQEYYGEQTFPDAQPVDGIGGRAFASVNAGGGVVDVQFVKDGRTGVVSYSAGPEVDVQTRVDAVEAVARKLADAI
jgi:hypothetical protein